MILVIAEPGDAAALWLSERMRLRADVGVVTPTQLVCSRSIIHRMSDAGAASRIALVSGPVIDSQHLTGVVNRLSEPPTAHFTHATPADRDYAGQELYAFLLGWLASLSCPVINRPTPSSLAGAWHGPIETEHFAAHCELPLYRGAPAPSVTSLFVLRGQMIGPILNARQRDALLQFAKLWGADLIQIDVTASNGRHELVRAASFADYRLGGDGLVRAVMRVFAP